MLTHDSTIFQPQLCPHPLPTFIPPGPSSNKSESLPSFLERDSQGPWVSGGTTWAQALDNEDGAHHDAHEAHGQPHGADHSLCQL